MISLAAIAIAFLGISWAFYKLNRRMASVEEFLLKQFSFNKNAKDSIEILSSRIGKQEERLDNLKNAIEDVSMDIANITKA